MAPPRDVFVHQHSTAKKKRPYIELCYTKMLFSLCNGGDKSVALPAKGSKMKFQR